jgi:hypothetical protein
MIDKTDRYRIMVTVPTSQIDSFNLRGLEYVDNEADTVTFFMEDTCSLEEEGVWKRLIENEFKMENEGIQGLSLEATPLSELRPLGLSKER